jgi:hypothetical protein
MTCVTVTREPWWYPVIIYVATDTLSLYRFVSTKLNSDYIETGATFFFSFFLSFKFSAVIHALDSSILKYGLAYLLRALLYVYFIIYCFTKRGGSLLITKLARLLYTRFNVRRSHFSLVLIPVLDLDRHPWTRSPFSNFILICNPYPWSW